MKIVRFCLLLLAVYFGCLSCALVAHWLDDGKVQAQNAEAKTEPISTTALYIVDSKGRKRILLGVRDDNAIVYMTDSDEKPLVSVKAGDSATTMEMYGAGKDGGDLKIQVARGECAMEMVSTLHHSGLGLSLAGTGPQLHLVRFDGSTKDDKVTESVLEIVKEGSNLLLGSPRPQGSEMTKSFVQAASDLNGKGRFRIFDKDGNQFWGTPEQK